MQPTVKRRGRKDDGRRLLQDNSSASKTVTRMLRVMLNCFPGLSVQSYSWSYLEVQTMRSIVLTYPGYMTLPKGIKQMLVVSEAVFFADAAPAKFKPAQGKLGQRRVLAPPMINEPGRQWSDLSGNYWN